MAAEFASFLNLQVISTLGIVAELGIILVFATLLAFIGRFFRQPIILSYIVAGLIIGPLGLNLITHTEIPLISELGIAFLLFTVGVETDFSKLKKVGPVVVLGGFFQVFLTAAISYAAAAFMGFDFVASVYVGMILAFSSTMIVIKMLSDRGEINTLHGRLLVGFLLVQDFLVILALPLLANFSSVLDPAFFGSILLKGAGLFAVAVLLRKYVFPKLVEVGSSSDELMYLGGVSVCFVFIFVAFLLNFSPVVGAFLAGISLSPLAYHVEAKQKIRGLRDFFVTVFFVSLGLQITLFFSPEALPFLVAVIFLLCFVVFIAKPLIFAFINLYAGYGGRTAVIVGLSLAQISEFSFILAAQGFNAGVLSQEFYSVLVLFTAVSMAITPYLINNIEKIYRLFSFAFRHTGKLEFSKKLDELENLPETSSLKNHVVVVGGGVLGSGIIETLRRSQNLVVVDHNPEVVFEKIGQGVNTVYGNIENDEIWRKINLRHCRLLVMTIPDAEKAVKLVERVKRLNPQVTVFARAKRNSDALSLYRAKADFVVLPEVIGGNVFIKNVANFLETGKVFNIANLETEYMRYLEEMVSKEKKRFRL